jgi:exosortase/archaeosortase family protein
MDHKRTSSQSQFGVLPVAGFRRISRNLFIVLVFVLMSLPLITTFNEILTKIVEKTGTYTFLTKNVVPFETRAVSLILKPLGIDAKPTVSHLIIQRDGKTTGIFFSWNCLGWQSAVLLILTLVTGLIGNYKWEQKLETILLGISGTFLINLLRISIVVIVAFYFGQLPATIVHDYGGTLYTIAWFFLYWWFSYRYLLEEKI